MWYIKCLGGTLVCDIDQFLLVLRVDHHIANLIIRETYNMVHLKYFCIRGHLRKNIVNLKRLEWFNSCGSAFNIVLITNLMFNNIQYDVIETCIKIITHEPSCLGYFSRKVAMKIVDDFKISNPETMIDVYSYRFFDDLCYLMMNKIH